MFRLNNYLIEKLFLEQLQERVKFFQYFSLNLLSNVFFKGHISIVETLFKDSRFDPTIDDNYPIRVANQYKRENVVNILQKDPRVSNKIQGEIPPLFPVPKGVKLKDIGWMGVIGRETTEGESKKKIFSRNMKV